MHSLFHNCRNHKSMVKCIQVLIALTKPCVSVLYLQSNHWTEVPYEPLSSGQLQGQLGQYNFGDSGAKLGRINKTFPGILHFRSYGHYEKAELYSVSLFPQCTSCHCVRTSCLNSFE